MTDLRPPVPLLYRPVVEAALREDLGLAGDQTADGVIPADSYYEHDDHELRTENLQEDEFINGHAHCRQMMTGTASVTIPVVDGEVLLGTWQRVLFVEFDQARERRVVFHRQGI